MIRAIAKRRLRDQAHPVSDRAVLSRAGGDWFHRAPVSAFPAAADRVAAAQARHPSVVHFGDMEETSHD